MKKYITKEELPDILSDLADKFLDNLDKIALDINLVRFTDNCRPNLTIKVSSRETGEELTYERYDIIDMLHDCYDVYTETISEAINKLP